MIKYILFDLDGTLTNSTLGITNSIMHALSRMGREIPPRESLYRYIGPPLAYSFQDLGMTEAEAKTAITLYREHYAVDGIYENEVYSGIPEALEQLKNSGYTLLTATSKPEKFAKMIIEHFSLDKYFKSVCGATMDEKRVKKADVIRYAMESNGISPEETVMVGDRLHDVEGAKECGLKSIGVLWGFGSMDELTEAGADKIAETPDELLSVIREMEK